MKSAEVYLWGTRGLGALEYHPATDYAKVKDLDISALVDVASEVLKRG